MKRFTPLLASFLFLSCNTPKPAEPRIAPAAIKQDHQYRSIKSLDSFLNANSGEIKKNAAMKERRMSSFAKAMLPQLDKGLYADIPFKLVVTDVIDGVTLGNFIYDDDKHFIKVTCVIPDKKLSTLEEKEKYYIKFINAKYQEPFELDNGFTNIQFPVVYATLVSASNKSD